MRMIIEELIENGSDPEALIKYHLSADGFDIMEKVAVEAFEISYEVTDAEELKVGVGTYMPRYGQ